MVKSILLSALAVAATVSSLWGQSFHPDYLDGNLYLKVKDTSSVTLVPYNNTIPALNLLLSTYGVDSIYQPFKTPDPALQKVYRLSFTNISGTGSLLLGLQALGFVEYAEQVPLMQTVGTTYLPNDLQLNQWGLAKIQAPLAWDLGQGSNTVVVAIIDNAFRTTHEDLASVYYVNPGEVPNNLLDDDFNGYIDDVKGYDVADMDNNVNPPATTPDWDHGTHCAGIAGASTDNGLGIASIGFGIRILPVKASSSATPGNTLEKAYESVDYAMRAGADVISMSWGSIGQSATGNLLLSVARSQNIVLIAAAGNSNDSVPFYPAAYTTTMAVGSTDQTDMRSGFSNYGSYVDVMAPGGGIYSCLANADNSYGNLSGTSMACPLVAGLAGLMLSSQATTEAAIKQAIVDGCENIDALNPGFAGKLGAGRINAYNSMSALVSRTEEAAMVPVQVFPNPSTGIVHVRLDPMHAGPATVAVVDMLGRVLLTVETTHSQVELDLSAFAAGVYHIHVRTAQGLATERLLKQ